MGVPRGTIRILHIFFLPRRFSAVHLPKGQEKWSRHYPWEIKYGNGKSPQWSFSWERHDFPARFGSLRKRKPSTRKMPGTSTELAKKQRNCESFRKWRWAEMAVARISE
jgi:hypothetical protein